MQEVPPVSPKVLEKVEPKEADNSMGAIEVSRPQETLATDAPLDQSVGPSSHSIGELPDPSTDVRKQHDGSLSTAPESTISSASDDPNDSVHEHDDPMHEAPLGFHDVALDPEHVDALSLPQAKIRRIMQMDPAYVGVSRGAVYATGLATELFIQHLTEQASLMAKVDRRKKIQYKDLSSAVDHHDAFSFLSDTIPKTQILADLVKNNSVALSTDTLPLEPDFSFSSGKSLREAPEVSAKTKKPKPDHSKPAQASLPKGQQTLAFAHNSVSVPGPSVLIDLVDTETQPSSAEIVGADVEMHDVDGPVSTS